MISMLIASSVIIYTLGMISDAVKEELSNCHLGGTRQAKQHSSEPSCRRSARSNHDDVKTYVAEEVWL